MTEDVTSDVLRLKHRRDLTRWFSGDPDVPKDEDETPAFVRALWNDEGDAPWPLQVGVPYGSWAWFARLLHQVLIEGVPAFDPEDVDRAFSSEVKPLDFDEQSQS
jgi:hypothetical protein